MALVSRAAISYGAETLKPPNLWPPGCLSHPTALVAPRSFPFWEIGAVSSAVLDDICEILSYTIKFYIMAIRVLQYFHSSRSYLHQETGPYLNIIHIAEINPNDHPVLKSAKTVKTCTFPLLKKIVLLPSKWNAGNNNDFWRIWTYAFVPIQRDTYFHFLVITTAI